MWHDPFILRQFGSSGLHVGVDIPERPLPEVIEQRERERVQVYDNMYLCISGIYPSLLRYETNKTPKKRGQFQAHTVYINPPPALALDQYLVAARIVKHIVLGTLAEAIHGAVGRGEMVWLRHVVALLVLPVHGVLCALDTLGSVVLAVDGSPRPADSVRVGGAGYVADKWRHVHLVRAADGFVDPEPVFVCLCQQAGRQSGGGARWYLPRTHAPVVRAGWEVGDAEGLELAGGTVMDDREDDEVFGLHLVSIALIGDGERASGDIVPPRSVHVYAQLRLAKPKRTGGF